MKVHVLVEGPSETAFVTRWAKRAFPSDEVVVHHHQGKGALPKKEDAFAKPNPLHRGLLDMLPAKLRAFGTDPNNAVLVLVDADNEECTDLKRRLVEMAETVATKSQLPKLVFRIAVEETEAFYFGDLRALSRAFPNADLAAARSYLPDSKDCGTAELFGKVIGDGGLNKVWWAEQMGDAVTTNPSQSRSPSFKALHAGLSRLLASVAKPKKTTKKHWKARSNAWRTGA